MIGWIIDLIPYWVWIIIAVIALAATAQVWLPLWAMTPRWLKSTLIAVASLGTVYLAGRNRGASNERQRQQQADANAVKNRKDIDDAVGNKSRSDVDRDLGKWLRD